MPSRSDLFDGCAASHALDLIGERWALLIVRDLLLGPKRFTDLRRGLPRISRNVLSQRLLDLQAGGIVSRRVLPPPSGAAVYELTELGLELESVIQAIGRWAVKSPLMPLSDALGADAFVLGLRARFDASAAGGTRARYELRVGAEVFAFEAGAGALEVRRGGCDDPDLVIEADTAAIAAAARGDLPLIDALTAAGAGSRGLDGFVALFRPVEEPDPLAAAR